MTNQVLITALLLVPGQDFYWYNLCVHAHWNDLYFHIGLFKTNKIIPLTSTRFIRKTSSSPANGYFIQHLFQMPFKKVFSGEIHSEV